MVNENFSYNYFDAVLMFRNAIFVNRILSSLEATNHLTNANIARIEEADRYLMSKLFLSGSRSPVLGYFWECGILPLRFVLMGRRIMFLWSILQKESTEAVKALAVAK